MSKEILIVRLSAIGDVIQSTPVARQLKRLHPDWRITWAVEPKGLAGIKHNPHVDAIEVVDTRRLSSWCDIARRLRGRFEVTLDLQCLIKAGLVTRLVGSPVRIGRDDAREGSRVCYTRWMPTRMDHLYISQHYLEQAADLGTTIDDYVPELFLDPADEEAAGRLWHEHGLDDGRPVIALIAFAAEPTREWPTERYAQVADALSEEYGARCLLLGTKAELPRAEALAATMRQRPVILAGQTSLGQAAALLKRCRLAIGADTGLIHYSFALGTPLVCLLGPSPLRNGPKSEQAVTVAVECPHRPCRPSDRCRLGTGRVCMERIEVAQVVEAARKLM